jgi:hypothetical protein
MTGGRVADLRSELMAQVAPAVAGQLVPEDLYLRTGFFQAADVDRWSRGPLETKDLRPPGNELVLEKTTGPTQEFVVTCEQISGDLLFVPNGAVALRDIGELHADLARGWFRRARPEAATYRVMWHEPGREGAVDTARRELTALPPGLDRPQLQVLLESWRPSENPTAWEWCTHLAKGLANRCSYSLIEPSGPHSSALMNFLYGSRTGYCMHFASAAAVLLRMASVPCRIAVGLHGGAPNPDLRGARSFSSLHAHAWVELPVAGGWAVFDPTPATQRGHMPQNRLFAPEPESALAAPAVQGSPLLRLRELLLSPWLALALLLAVLAGPSLLPRRRRRLPALPREVRPARALLDRILAELHQRGLPRPSGQTLEQYALALPQSAPALAAAFAAYQEVRFGNRPLDAGREERLHKGLAAARTLGKPAS